MRLRILATAVGIAATATIAAATAHAATPAHQAAAVPAAAHSAAPAKAATVAHKADVPAVQVVRPGQLVNAGHGEYLKLTRTERCVGTPPEDWFTCKSVDDGNQSNGTVGVQSDGTFYSPLYVGSGQVARMTLTVGGVTYQVHVVTLAGHSGYATGFVWGAPNPTTGFPAMPEIKVYDAAGKVLAQL